VLPILTPAESAVVDRDSAARGVTVDALMENAGRMVARASAQLAGGTYGRRAVVVCGKGNNAGDGLVAARHLERWGMGVAVVLVAGASGFRGAAAANLRRFAEPGGRVREFGRSLLEHELARADVAIDAMFGTGFRGAPADAFAESIRVLNAAGAPVVAVDIPSGVEGETGAVRTEAVRATRTVTFGALKPGVVLLPGADHAGEVEVADIGFPPGLIHSDLWLVERADVARLLPSRPAGAHKRASTVLVVAGSRAMTGAAILCASGAARAGAGLVTLAVPEGILRVVQGALTEAVFLPLPETRDGTLAPEAAGALLERLASVRAVALGPGLTTNPDTGDLVRRLVAESPAPVVLDADGLNAFSGNAAALADRLSPAVLTPHAGEFGRLRGISAEEVEEDRVGHTRKAAAELRCVVLLKGPRTIVASADGRATVNPTGGPYLATGGTGDVLTGAIAALLSRGMAPADAAMAGAFVHGEAGRRAAMERGDGTTSADLPVHLAMVLTSLRPGPPPPSIVGDGP
jgi:hydroxyethylthiazole kinase-like uncharacterized protein yjeF